MSYICEKCGKEYKVHGVLEQHRASCLGTLENDVELIDPCCRECKIQFSSHVHLSRHLISRCANKRINENKIKELYISHDNVDEICKLASVTEKFVYLTLFGEFLCLKCGKKFSRMRDLLIHADCRFSEERCSEIQELYRNGMTQRKIFKLGYSTPEIETSLGRIDKKELEKINKRHRKHTKASKEKMSANSNTHSTIGGASGWFEGNHYQSSWELAFAIYNRDNEIKIFRNTERFQYNHGKKIRHYIPDFVNHDKSEYFEIKGRKWHKRHVKYKRFKKKLTFLFEKDIRHVLSYVKLNYGNDFIRLYEIN